MALPLVLIKVYSSPTCTGVMLTIIYRPDIEIKVWNGLTFKER